MDTIETKDKSLYSAAVDLCIDIKNVLSTCYGITDSSISREIMDALANPMNMEKTVAQFAYDFALGDIPAGESYNKIDWKALVDQRVEERYSKWITELCDYIKTTFVELNTNAYGEVDDEVGPNNLHELVNDWIGDDHDFDSPVEDEIRAMFENGMSPEVAAAKINDVIALTVV
jgi:hypothetical protein